MTRTMRDSVTAADIPIDGLDLVAGYIDHPKFTWTEADWSRFPAHVKRVRIAVNPATNDGDVGDVESTDMTPETALAWVKMRRASGANPTLYLNLSNVDAVRSAFAAAGERVPEIWLAHYGAPPVIPDGFVAIQYANEPLTGGHFDASIVADHWETIDGPRSNAGPRSSGKLRMVAGHGGQDAGAQRDGRMERDMNRDVVLSFNDASLRDYAPQHVEIAIYPASDPRDGNAVLLDKIAQANAAGPDQLLIEVHHNVDEQAAGGTQIWISQRAKAKPGDETWIIAPILATEIGFLIGQTPPVLTSDRSRFGKLGILDDTTCTAIIVEARDIDLVSGPDWEYSFGATLARACAKFFGWPSSHVTPPPVATPPAPSDDRLDRAKKIVSDAAAQIAAL